MSFWTYLRGAKKSGKSSVADEMARQTSTTTNPQLPTPKMMADDLATDLFDVTTQNGTLTIMKYKGSDLTVMIPGTITGLPVTRIGDQAFSGCTNLLGIVIPDTVTSIGDLAFASCDRLQNVSIGNGVTTIGQAAFYHCVSLYSVTISKSVLIIEDKAFWDCLKLTKITLADSVTQIGNGAFHCCLRLQGIYFEGNAPRIGEDAFQGTDNVIVFYRPNTKGWTSSFGGRPTALWEPN